MKSLTRILRSRIFIVAAALVLAYTLFGFLLAPYLVSHYVPRIVQERLDKHAALGEVRINPYLFTFEANDLRLTQPDGRPMVEFKRLFLDFELKSLFKWAWTFRQVSLEGLNVHAVIEEDGGLNLAGLIPPSEPSPAEKEEGELPRMLFEELLVDQARIDLTDRRQSRPAVITVQPFTLLMRDLATLPGQEGSQTITATTSRGESFKWNGKLSLNPVSVKADFSIENLNLSTLSQFAGDALNLEPPDGRIKLSGHYEFGLAGDQARLLIAGLSAALTGVGLRLQGEEDPFLEIPGILLSDGRFDLSGRKAEIGRLTVEGGRARLSIDEKGRLNVQRVAGSEGDTRPAAPLQSDQGGGSGWKVFLKGFAVDGFSLDYMDRSRTPGLRAGVERFQAGLRAEAEFGDRTQVKLSDIGVGVAGVQAGFPDGSEPVVRIEKAGLGGGAYDLAENRLTADHLSIEAGHADVRLGGDGRLNLAVLLGQQGEGAAGETQDEAAAQGQPFRFLVRTLSLAGLQVALSDLSVREEGPVLHLEEVSATAADVDGRSPTKFDLSIRVREGGLAEASGTVDPSAPSVESDIRIADLGLPPFQPYLRKAAEVILDSGALSTRGTLRHGIQSAGAETVYQGGFNLERVHVTEVDGRETLVGWDSLKSDELKLHLGPDSVEVGEVDLSGLAGKIIIEKNKTLNLANVIKSDEEPREEGRQDAGTDEAFPYRVRRVLLGEGRVDFADLSLPLPFATKVHELKGFVAGISSTRNARAQVKLDGHVDEYGTVKAEGELNTSDPKAFTDIDVTFRNVEMSKLTSYSGKFAGREIDSGKLSADLEYKIVDGELAGDNQIVVERLVLGQKVESPDAVNLPLDLAVALLEDSNGVIELGLPVHGDLDSPQFSFGALVGKAILNLLTKIVTSPFRALAALIPGSGEESFKEVAFEPGRAELPPPQREKLARLADVLKRRPQLKLLIQGGYNPESDGAALRTARLGRDLSARLGEKPAPDADPAPVDYSSPETVKALEAMFSERFGADALRGLKAELFSPKGDSRDQGRRGPVAKERRAVRGSEAEDPGQLSKLLFNRLQAVEPVPEAALTQLAEARARAVFAELSQAHGVATERLGIHPPAALESDPAAELALESMR